MKKILLGMLVVLCTITSFPSSERTSDTKVLGFYPDWYELQEYFVVDQIDTLKDDYVRLSYQGKIIGIVSHQSLKKVPWIMN
tara:strand:- start:1431 stop:1676 length:246 start_codon:yes stop_codon:yes gene_type:complete